MYGLSKTRRVWAPSRGAGFNALQFPNCGAWWRADQVSIAPGANHSVVSIPDLSGNGAHLVEYSALYPSRRAVYIPNGWKGHPALYFQQTIMQNTAFAFGTNRAMIFVYHCEGGQNQFDGGNAHIFSVGNTAGTGTCFSYGYTSNAQVVHLWNTLTSFPTAPDKTRPLVIVLTYNQLSSLTYLYCNGALLGTYLGALGGTASFVRMGEWVQDNYWGSWAFYEAALYNRYFSPAEVADVTAMLCAYYRIG